MTTTLIELEVTDEYDNPKKLKATSFYGGKDRGIMLSLVIRHSAGNYAHMSAELTKENAINLAKSILEKFEDA
jgi:hypothetical protein